MAKHQKAKPQILHGGWGPEQQCGGELQALVDNNPKMTALVRTSMNDQVLQITSLTYRSQVVGGTNYVIKGRTQDNVYLLLRISEPLPGQGPPELVRVMVTQPIETEF
ncbi:Hypothetical predicted protein [Mytilus galloprovincialis]|uniref:Cystatin domain-containing protein n=1 Tax=Mytilus galloprovincialis TaxID=29158 RepID=A0A8B6CU16_MYTGA|nr:Hypothetical predicted protein [Mytilus galloprovincialis]